MRALFSKAYECENRRRPNMGKFTRYALYVAIVSALWAGFKKFEPAVFPVVKGFEITSAKNEAGGKLRISGAFDKVRPCEFVEVIGYSGSQFVSIAFAGLPGAQVPSRLTGRQTYGPWVLVPEVNQLELYSRHKCATGQVVTKLFNGAIVL